MDTLMPHQRHNRRPRVRPMPFVGIEELTALIDECDDGDVLAEALIDLANTLQDITEDDASRPAVNTPNKVARRALQRLKTKLEDAPVTRETTDGPGS